MLQAKILAEAKRRSSNPTEAGSLTGICIFIHAAASEASSIQILAQIGFLIPDSRLAPMPGINERVFRQSEDLSKACPFLFWGGVGQIVPADAEFEQSIAREKDPLLFEIEAD